MAPTSLARTPLRRSNYPIPCELPQAEIDIWRQHHDLLEASHHICDKMLSRWRGSASFKKEVTDIGGDVYLKTLMKLDDEAKRWIDAILAGGN